MTAANPTQVLHPSKDASPSEPSAIPAPDSNPAASSGVHPKGTYHPTVLPPPQEAEIILELRSERERVRALLIVLFYVLYKPNNTYLRSQARQELRDGIYDLMEDSEKKVNALKVMLPHTERICALLAPHGQAIYKSLLNEFKDEPKLVEALHTLRSLF